MTKPHRVIEGLPKKTNELIDRRFNEFAEKNGLTNLSIPFTAGVLCGIEVAQMLMKEVDDEKPNYALARDHLS